MILGATAAVLFPFLVAGTIVYVQLSETLTKSAEEDAIDIAQNISSFIDIVLRQEIKLASSLAADTDIVQASKTEDYRTAQDELGAILERIDDDILSIFLTDKYGILRADARYPQQIGLDLSDRKYFLKAKDGKANATDPFMPKGKINPGKPIIVVCAPIMEDGVFLGLAAITFHTDFIFKQILKKNSSQTGNAYLISNGGTILVHPREEYILKYRLFDHPGTEALKRLVKSRKVGITYFSFRLGENRQRGQHRTDRLDGHLFLE